MWSKIKGFFGSFFHNIVADPASSAKGVVQLAAAGAACYGMATGVVPINVGAPMAASFAASGVHALGTDTSGSTAPAAAKVEQLIQEAAVIAPQAMTINDHYQAIQQQTGQAQAVLAAATEAATALSAMTATPVPASVVASAAESTATP
jgi:hypothetical protein